MKSAANTDRAPERDKDPALTIATLARKGLMTVAAPTPFKVDKRVRRIDSYIFGQTLAFGVRYRGKALLGLG